MLKLNFDEVSITKASQKLQNTGEIMRLSQPAFELQLVALESRLDC